MATKRCTEADRRGRLAKARQFLEAAELLALVDKTLLRDLSKLLGMKTRAGYSSTPVSAANARSAVRSATRLVAAATSS